MGMFSSIFAPILLIRHIARIFLSMDKSIIGLRLVSGPLCFPGFCSGVRIPSLISFGYSPVLDISFRIFVISVDVISPPSFSCSALMLSPPALLLFFSDLSQFLSQLGSLTWSGSQPVDPSNKPYVVLKPGLVVSQLNPPPPPPNKHSRTVTAWVVFGVLMRLSWMT